MTMYKQVDGVKVKLTAKEAKEFKARETAFRTKVIPPKPINMTLTRDENIKQIDSWVTDGIISVARATAMKA